MSAGELTKHVSETAKAKAEAVSGSSAAEKLALEEAETEARAAHKSGDPLRIRRALKRLDELLDD